jgi:PAS domain S-box-containing protein
MLSLPLRILYVDDEPSLLDIVKIFLERTKEFSVETCISSIEALNILKYSRFDAIVSDYQMPEMDGINFLIQVRAEYKDIPFILFTGRGREEVVINAINNGADFYVQKGGDLKAQFAELIHKIKIATQKNQAIRDLAANEERMRLALDGTREAHWEINTVTGKSFISHRGYEMLGYNTPEETEQLDGYRWREITHPDDVNKTEAVLQEYYKGNLPFFQVEQRLKMKTGEWKWMLVRGKVIEYDKDNNPIRFVGTHTDITEQKKAELELLAAKKDWETIFRAIGNPTLIIGTDNSIIDANEAMVNLTGMPLENIRGKKCWNIFHGDDATTTAEICPFVQTQKTGHLETMTVNSEAYGRIFIISCTPVYDDAGSITKTIHIATDITENKQLEYDLTESRDYLNQIFSSVKEGIVIIDALTHQILDVNPAASQMIRAGKEKIVGNVCHRYICPAEVSRCPITDLNQEVDNAERELLTADGNCIPIIKHVVPFNFHGRACLLETFIDNSERKKALDELVVAYKKISDDEKTLREQYAELVHLKNSLETSEKKFKTIIETTPDVIWDITFEGIVTYISPRCNDIFGYSQDQLMGRSIIDLLPIEKRDEVKVLLEEARTRKPGIISKNFNFTHRNGSELIANVRSSLLLDETGTRTGLRCVVGDVTDLIRSMETLKDQKLRIERLSEQKDLFLYQLAHDLRTPLTPIIGMGPLLVQGISDPDAQELIRIFLHSIEYLRKMVEDILLNAELNRTYALDSFENYNVLELITDAIDANKYLADQKDLSITYSVSPDITIPMSRPYANQVFRNLVNNAVKYNYPKGRISITVTAGKEKVEIIISDTGIGIKPEIIDKIWDELFVGDSSRHDPLSKGFGLAIVKKIVELHNGKIKAISEGDQKGSTFIIHLPLTEHNVF